MQCQLDLGCEGIDQTKRCPADFGESRSRHITGTEVTAKVAGAAAADDVAATIEEVTLRRWIPLTHVRERARVRRAGGWIVEHHDPHRDDLTGRKSGRHVGATDPMLGSDQS